MPRHDMDNRNCRKNVGTKTAKVKIARSVERRMNFFYSKRYYET